MKLNQRTLDNLLQMDIIRDIVMQSVCFGTSWQKSAKFIVNKLKSEITTMDTRKKIVSKISMKKLFCIPD